MLDDALKAWAGTLVCGFCALGLSTAITAFSSDDQTTPAEVAASPVPLPIKASAVLAEKGEAQPAPTKFIQSSAAFASVILGTAQAAPARDIDQSLEIKELIVVPSPRKRADLSPDPASHSANANLHVSEDALNMIKRTEPFFKEAQRAQHGIWVVGYGHTATAHSGMKVTDEEADFLLRQDLRDVERLVKQALFVPVNENEFGALVSLAHNVGTLNFLNSSVVARINDGDKAGAAEAFLVWNKVRVQGQTLPSERLTKRRERERYLFLAG